MVMNSSEQTTARCPKCGASLLARGEEGTSIRCNQCGSELYFKYLEGSITPSGYLLRRARSPSKANYRIQREEGDSFYRKTGRWHKLIRIIDRVRKWYYEHIVDSETGEVISHKDQSLTDHRRIGNPK